MKTAVVIIAVLSIPVIAFAATIYVPDDYPTIQGAIDAAVNGDIVIVRPGTFQERLDFSGKAITVMSEQGPAKTAVQSDGYPNHGPGVRFTNGEGPDSVFDGFTVEQFSNFDWPGGVEIFRASPTLVNCVFSENSTPYGSGAMGMAGPDASPSIKDCVFSQNDAAIGAGIYAYLANPTVTNSVFVNNSGGRGVGMFLSSTDMTVTNCTFTKNTAILNGAAIKAEGTSNLIMTNSIAWNDAPDELSIGPYATATVTYSDVQGGYTGMGNIDADPLFVDSTEDDFHLTFGSPCKDSGDNSAVVIPTDFEGDPRIVYDTVDMGADEFYTHLYITGDQTPGGSIQGKFVGLPGTSPVRLFIGLGGVRPTPLPTIYGDLWLLPPRMSIPLIPIPANGILAIPATLPPTPPAPYDVPMQGLIGLNSDSLTNLCVLEVR